MEDYRRSRRRQGCARDGRGLARWRFGAFRVRLRIRSAAPCASDGHGEATDGARARASDAALAFVASCGLGDGHVISALRPEDEARLYALNEAPEAREAFVARTLTEWFTPRLDYTWVQLAFTLRGLPVAPCYWPGADGVSRACVANLYLGDGGELRDFTLSYVPCEAGAAPYAGTLKRRWRRSRSWPDSLTASGRLPARMSVGAPCPPHWPVALDIRPAYHTADGVTFFPAWLITVAWQESGGQTGMPWLAVIDARKP